MDSDKVCFVSMHYFALPTRWGNKSFSLKKKKKKKKKQQQQQQKKKKKLFLQISRQNVDRLDISLSSVYM